jgi:peptide deformylase
VINETFDENHISCYHLIVVKILQKESSLLRKTAEPVSLSTINTPEFKKMLMDMHEAILSQDDAVAVAAPQIGILKRVFAISGRVFDNFEIKENPHPDLIFINPEIVKISKDKKVMTEGCLSVRYLYGKIRRASRATIRAYNEKGQKIERGASGLLAQIFQHEVDHLNGVLFIDRAKDLQNIPPEKQRSSKKTEHKTEDKTVHEHK